MTYYNEPACAAQALARFLRAYPQPLVLTGAGISTDSGIPAYRNRQGQWQHPTPIQHQTFLHSHQARQRFWARSLIGWPLIRDAKPNGAHHLLVHLHQQGWIGPLVTQNVDRLHQQAGHPQVIDLHGRSDQIICCNCQRIFSRQWHHQQLAAHNPDFLHYQAHPAPDGDAHLDGVAFDHLQLPDCPVCGGILKPHVVFFGDHIPPARLRIATQALLQSKALLVIGSSLMVYSGFRFCKQAKAADFPIAALTQGTTRADALLTEKYDTHIHSTLENLVAILTASGPITGREPV